MAKRRDLASVLRHEKVELLAAKLLHDNPA